MNIQEEIMKDFLRGAGSVLELFPVERDVKISSFQILILSDEEAFKADLEAVGRDMYSAIETAKNSYEPEIMT